MGCKRALLGHCACSSWQSLVVTDISQRERHNGRIQGDVLRDGRRFCGHFVVELRPGGAEQDVTEANKDQQVDLAVTQ